jgi:hypothetical protein
MSLKTRIQDGEGSNLVAGVTPDHALKVSLIPFSYRDLVDNHDFDRYELLTRRKVLVESLANSSGSTDFRVDGSVTTQDFAIESEMDTLKSVCCLRLVFHDTQMSLGSAEGSRFGSSASSPGLTNGLRLFADQGGEETDIFITPVKAIAEFLEYGEVFNQAGALGAGLDILVITLVLPEPIVLPPGSKDRLVLQVRDDLTPIDTKALASAQGWRENFTETG